MNTATVTAPIAANLLRIGQPIPGLPDHLYAGMMRGEGDQQDYPLAVLTGPTAARLKGAWGDYGRAVADTNHRRDGLANTTAMAAAGSALAQAVLEAGAYIASQCEADLVRANVREHMAAGWHWTSTQYSPDRAWAQGFEYGSSDLYCKSYEFRAVAVRRFILQSFGPSDAASADAAPAA